MGCIYTCEHECLCMCVSKREIERGGVLVSAQTTRRKPKGLILKHTHTRCPGLGHLREPDLLCPQLHHQDAFLPRATPFCMCCGNICMPDRGL